MKFITALYITLGLLKGSLLYSQNKDDKPELDNTDQSKQLKASSNDEIVYEPLVPTALMTEETKWLLGALEKAHFNKITLEELDSREFLENYVNNLDKQKLFLQALIFPRYYKDTNPPLRHTSNKVTCFQPLKYMMITGASLYRDLRVLLVCSKRLHISTPIGLLMWTGRKYGGQVQPMN